jgi:Na+-transporting methylmalonyl-CoA/oxaloacetate decarboxylase gamma subunit
MEFISKIFEAHVSFDSMLQIGVDVVILGLLIVILIVRKPRISKKDEAVIRSFEKIVEETAEISKRFEINLEKRQELLQQITANLDQRIQEAQGLCARMEQLPRPNAPRPNSEKLTTTYSPGTGTGPRVQGAEQQRVLALARKGLDASEIAKNLKRPVGEVELILNLQKIAS